MGRRFSLAVVVLAAMAGAFVSLPVRAWAAGFTYQLTITESAATSNYGDPSPTFRASVTVPSDDPPSGTYPQFFIRVDSTDYAGSLSGSYPTYSLYQSGVVSPPLAAGQHSAVARYLSTNHGWLTSTPVVFTVLKVTPALTCSFRNFVGSIATNASMPFDASFANTNAPVDVQNGTFTVVFAGAQTFSEPNLVANAFGAVTGATAPSVPGFYTLTCDFSGTSNFNAVSSSVGTILVSLYNKVGGIALYTNPAPITPGTNVTWEVVVTGGQGQPTPTGNITLTIENSSTSGVPPLSGGVTTFTAVAPVFVPSATIVVGYSGDTFYAPTAVSFPVATLPIPTSAPPSSAPPSPSPAKPGQQRSPSPASSPSSVPGESPTPTASQSASPSPRDRLTQVLTKSVGQSSSRVGLAASVMGGAGLVALVGLAAGLAWRRRQGGRL